MLRILYNANKKNQILKTLVSSSKSLECLESLKLLLLDHFRAARKLLYVKFVLFSFWQSGGFSWTLKNKCKGTKKIVSLSSGYNAV